LADDLETDHAREVLNQWYHLRHDGTHNRAAPPRDPGFSARAARMVEVVGCFVEIISYRTRLFAPIDWSDDIINKMLSSAP
jgi:hypothetical protein